MDVPQDQIHDYPPRLYAEVASNLESKVTNHNFHMGDFPIIREAIKCDVWDHLKEFLVRIIANLDDSKFLWSGRTVHCLLCIQLQVYKKEIWNLVITGLNTDPLPTKIFEPDQYKTFWEELNVPHGMGHKLDELRPALEVCRSWTFEKRKWLGLLLLQTMGLYVLHHNSRIPFESAKRVFDDEAKMTYPWGQGAYEVHCYFIKMLSLQGAVSSVADEADNPQLVNLITNIHPDRFIGSFWDVQRNEKKKRTKAEVSSAGKVATEEMTTVVLKSIIITLDNISRKVDNYDGRFEMVDLRLTVYDFNFVDLARDISNIDKNIGDRVEDAVYERLKDLEVGENNDYGNIEVDFVYVSPAKNPTYGCGCRGKPKQKEHEEVAAKKKKTAKLKKKKVEFKKQQKAAELKKQKAEEEERVKSARIKFYQERGVQLSPNGLAGMPTAVVPSARVFLYIEDNGRTCMRKDIEPSAAIYDPIELSDLVKIDKLMQHLQPFEYGPLHHFYEELVNDRIHVDVKTNLKWLQDVDHLYGVINTGGDHWVGFDVDLLKEKIDCYDPIIGQVTEKSEYKVLVAFRMFTQMIPAMMSEVIPTSIQKPSYKYFAFQRRKGKYIPQNDLVDDCGMYSLKCMECLALGVTFDRISDQNIQLENNVNVILSSADRDNLPVLNPGPDPRYNILVWTRFNMVTRTMFRSQMRELKRIWAHGSEKPKWMLTSVWFDLVDMFEKFGPGNFGFRM
ncbi:hypothetical protein N665_0087s0009 [Sinapis alba]|nr:hypothetical protein N665_0087s0009 [Sinapis alba]